MLPFDYCCSSVKKELKKRTCKVCNQYIPSAYRMKNHYKIHAQHYDDYDHDQEDTLPPPNDDDKKNINPNKPKTGAPAFKTEMLDWLRSDFEDVESQPKDRVTRSMENLHVEEQTNDDDAEHKDWVHVE